MERPMAGAGVLTQLQVGSVIGRAFDGVVSIGG
jgi:hypothetical protein